MSYLIECLKICRQFKADSLLSGQMNVEKLEEVIKDALCARWLGHSNTRAWITCRAAHLDEFGHDLTRIGNHSRDEVMDELVDLKEAAKAFAPKSPIFATEGMKSLDAADVSWLNQCTQHRGTLRQKLSTQEQEVYANFLSSQKPNLLEFAKKVTKLISGDTANKDAIMEWASRVAHGSHVAVPTAAAPQSNLASITNFIGQNARSIARLATQEVSTDTRI